MSNTQYKFKLDRKGVGELLKSDWALSIVEAKAKEVQARCGEGYNVTTYVGKKRCNASVRAASQTAYRDNAQNNTLLKELY